MAVKSSSAGLGWRLWFALWGINHGLDHAYHKAAKRFWAAFERKVGEQHKSVQYAHAAFKGLAQALAITFWDIKDELHIGARWGWIEGGHRHREWHELRHARRENGKDNPDYVTARQKVVAERADRKQRYELYATAHTRAASKGKPLPRLRDSVEPSAKPAKPTKPQSIETAPCCTHNGGDEMACPCGCHPWNQKQEPDQAVAATQPDGPVVDIQPKAPLAPTFQAPTTNGNLPVATELTTKQSAGMEVTNTQTWRALLENELQGITQLQEDLTSLEQDLQGSANNYEAAIAWMTSDEFDSATIGNAAAIQEGMHTLLQAIREALAAANSEIGLIDKAHQHSLQAHTHIEEAVSGGAAKSTASYQGG